MVYRPSSYDGIISLQVKNHPEVVPAVLTRLLSLYHAPSRLDDYKGQLLLVEPHRI